MQVSEEECLYIGDSEVDAATGKNAGLKTIGVLWDSGTNVKNCGNRSSDRKTGRTVAVYCNITIREVEMYVRI